MLSLISILYTYKVVPVEGLEPPRPKALVPKTSVYTNFTTPALREICTQNIPLYME